MADRSGGCLCGAVRYQAQGEPDSTAYCWCHACQHIGSGGTVNSTYRRGAVTITGDTDAYVRTADNGSEVHEHFCPKCGSQVFAESTGEPDIRLIRVGTLDDPSSVTPESYTWLSSKPSWGLVNANLTQYQTQP